MPKVDKEAQKYFDSAMTNLYEFGKEGADEFNKVLDNMFETTAYMNPLAPALTNMSTALKTATLESNLALMEALLELSNNEVVQGTIKAFSKFLNWILEGGADILDAMDKKLDSVWVIFSSIKNFFTWNSNSEAGIPFNNGLVDLGDYNDTSESIEENPGPALFETVAEAVFTPILIALLIKEAIGSLWPW